MAEVVVSEQTLAPIEEGAIASTIQEPLLSQESVTANGEGTITLEEVADSIIVEDVSIPRSLQGVSSQELPKEDGEPAIGTEEAISPATAEEAISQDNEGEEEDILSEDDVDYENHIPIIVELGAGNPEERGKQGFFSSTATQKPTIDVSAINNSVDNYLANASQQELTMLVKAVDSDKSKILEYIIKNQINEEYVAT